MSYWYRMPLCQGKDTILALRYALFGAWLALATCPAALAADDEQIREAVYRANLGRADDVALLIKQGVAPDQMDQDGRPLLAIAAARKDSESVNVMKALLAAGANINETDLDGQTALFYAAKSGNKDGIRFLLEHGINYYATDHKGMIARTIAYQEGHEDIVTAMDNFVLDQTAKVSEQYKQFNQAVEDQRKAAETPAPVEPQPPATEPAPAAESPEASAEESGSDYLASSSEEDEQENVDDAKIIAEKRASPEFRDQMRGLAYHSCAFQYWSFCRQVQQTSDLSADEMSSTIDGHRQDILDTTKHATDEYHLSNRYLAKVTRRAKEVIADDLNDMPSKTYRFEHGICKMEDAKSRCGLIADSWDQPKPVKQKSKKGGAVFQGGIVNPGANTFQNPGGAKPQFGVHKKAKKKARHKSGKKKKNIKKTGAAGL